MSWARTGKTKARRNLLPRGQAAPLGARKQGEAARRSSILAEPASAISSNNFSAEEVAMVFPAKISKPEKAVRQEQPAPAEAATWKATFSSRSRRRCRERFV